ncbi:MAG TPA: serine/threonine-protein kinase [Gemmatimonadales bacterium]|jgi:tetratricopeptide (TPR) repeat protein
MESDLRTQLEDALLATHVIERELSGGGMSRVFVAEEIRLGRRVVVKVLAPDLAQGISIERFQREIRLAASLQHAHIVPVLATGEVAGLPWFTMPFIDGESLRARTARGALPIGECISILRDVARALAYAHSRDVVHRDIKPDNVMFSAGSAVVTDFGIAKAIGAARGGADRPEHPVGAGDRPTAALTSLGTSIGTPAYMAPEQAAGDPNVDARADIYAFGCTAYELLSGNSPFSGRSPQAMLAAHMAEAPRPIRQLRPDTPPMLADLVMRSLAKDPGARPVSAAEIARTLDTITSGSNSVMPALLLGGAAIFRRAMAWYVVACVAVIGAAKALTITIGLPDWVVPGAAIVMLLGLPVILFTGYVQRVNQRLFTATPTLTPGGTPQVAAPEGTLATIALHATPHVSWRRTARGGIVAVVAFALTVAGFMTMRATGIGPFGSLLAAGSLHGRQEVLVTDFAVTNADTSLGRVLGDATRATLASSSAITLTSPVAIAAALQRMQQPPNAPVTFEVARVLAIRNRINVLVTGELTGLGASGFIVTLRMVTADSAKELASFRETARDPQGLIVAIDKLSRSLRGKVGESLRSVRATESLNDATTSSLDALRKYTAGERLYELERKYPEAIAVLRQAVAIDSTFAMAWREMAVVASRIAALTPLRDSAITQAYRFRERLHGSERDMVEGSYWSYAGHDRAKAADAFESMLRRGDTAGPGNNLGMLLGTRRDFAGAVALLYAQERACPGCFRPLYINLVDELMRAHRLAEADSVIAVGLTRFPKERSLARRHIEILYLRGDTPAYRTAVDSVLAHGDSDRTWARTLHQNLALRDGHIAEWRKSYYGARTPDAVATPSIRLNWATSAADASVRSEFEGRAHDVEQQLDSALAQYDIRSRTEGRRPYGDIVHTYAAAGRPDKARTWLARYDADREDTAQRREQLPARSWDMGDILRAEHRYPEAIAAYRAGDRQPDGPADACDICLSVELATLFDSLGQTDSAMAHYRRVVEGYSYERLSWDPYVLAPFTERLAELSARQGNRLDAAKYYKQFIALWSNADPVLQPRVAEARRQLAALGDVAATSTLPGRP